MLAECKLRLAIANMKRNSGLLPNEAATGEFHLTSTN